MSELVWPPVTARVESVDELQEQIRARAATEPRLLPRGSGARLGRGLPPAAEVRALDLRGLDRVVDHAADDLTVTVEAGLSLETLQAMLAEQNQWLPCAYPAVGGGTVGGMIAADRRFPLAGGCGSTRDYLLGITALDGAGIPIRAGARVVKSVAGYDFMKLFTGSLGEYGAIVEATFKVLPCPEVWGGVEAVGVDPSLVAAALHEGARAWFASGLWMLSSEKGAALLVVFAGSRERVSRQCETVRAFLGEGARVLDGHEVQSGLEHLDRLSAGKHGGGWGGVLPSHAVATGLPGTPGSWVVDLLAGNLWWGYADLPDADALAEARSWARAGTGQVHMDAGPQSYPRADAWGLDPGSSRAILVRLKQALDPRGAWVSGRHPGGV